MTFSGILTAMVTPFDADGGLAEEPTARLIRHLLANGSDGIVLTGTTGEASTLSDDEKARVWDIGVEVSRAERPDAPVIAGTGSNDTRHAVELTARAAAAGVDAALVVAPYYNRPNRRGLVAHFHAIANSTDLPIVLYNIPARSGVDMPNDLLAELGQVENVVAVKQARGENLAPIDGLDLLAGNDDMLAAVLDLGGTGGILVASHLVGEEMRRMIDEPGPAPRDRGEPHAALRCARGRAGLHLHQGGAQPARPRRRRRAAADGRGHVRRARDDHAGPGGAGLVARV